MHKVTLVNANTDKFFTALVGGPIFASVTEGTIGDIIRSITNFTNGYHPFDEDEVAYNVYNGKNYVGTYRADMGQTSRTLRNIRMEHEYTVPELLPEWS